MSTRRRVHQRCRSPVLCLKYWWQCLWHCGCTLVGVSSGASSWMIYSQRLQRCVRWSPLWARSFPPPSPLDVDSRRRLQLLADASFIIQIILVVVYHQDRHTWDIPLKDLHKSQKLGFIYSIVFAEAACQSKLSLLFFARIMIGDFRSNTFYPHYICLYTLVMTVTICQVLFVIVACVECRYVWPTAYHVCLSCSST